MGETKIEMKIDEEIKPLKELCEKVVKMVSAEFEKNPEQIETHEMYEVADIIKDLAEAKKYTVEACYKKYLLGVMEKNEDDYGDTWDEDGAWDDEGRRYYRGQARSKTSGRYMSRGDGRRNNGGRMGYDEIMPMDYRMDVIDYRTMSPEELRQRDRMMGRMYYTDTTGNSMAMMNNSAMRTGNMPAGQNMNDGDRPVRGYSDGYSDGMREGQRMNSRDPREGRNGRARRTYMETRDAHKGNTAADKQAKNRELDTYMNELGTDIKEMVHDMENDEKTLLKQKMQNIINTL